MRSSTLSELPPPPPGKTGWPWTEETPQLPDIMPNGSPWPRISIVTPSYNQGQFIEETIRSVLLQGYPNLEYIIIDGGSTDNSVEIIKKYAPWLAYWVSEKDRGQSHAINKGFERSTGEIMAWLNSDDILLWGALGNAALCMPFTADVVLGIGARYYIDSNSTITGFRPILFGQTNLSFISWGLSPGIYQESSFWNRSAWAHCGPLNENLYGAFDLEFFGRILSQTNHRVVRCHLYNGAFRKWGDTKCEADNSRVMDEDHLVRQSYRKKSALLKYKLTRRLCRIIIDLLGTYSNWNSAKIGKQLSFYS
ncbi:MAG: glycosyltransferase [Chloroflexi bacterium]|nr:glycosyltransferase [Chloroflexota bacterium]